MKRFLILAIAALAILRLPAHAEPRVYDATQLEALTAPFALYPDSLLSSVLARSHSNVTQVPSNRPGWMTERQCRSANGSFVSAARPVVDFASLGPNRRSARSMTRR